MRAILKLAVREGLIRRFATHPFGAPLTWRPAQRVALLVAPSCRVRLPPGDIGEINVDGGRF